MHHPGRVEFGSVILVFPVNRPARLEVGEKLVADVFLGWAIRSCAVAQGATAETHIPNLEPGRGLGTNLGGGGWRQVHWWEPAWFSPWSEWKSSKAHARVGSIDPLVNGKYNLP